MIKKTTEFMVRHGKDKDRFYTVTTISIFWIPIYINKVRTK